MCLLDLDKFPNIFDSIITMLLSELAAAIFKNRKKNLRKYYFLIKKGSFLFKLKLPLFKEVIIL